MQNSVLKFLCLAIFFILNVPFLKAQYKWSVGAYFLPSYVQYSFGQQQVNINLISGIGISREIKGKVLLNTGLFYFRNQLYGDTYACRICQSSPVGAVGSYKSHFIEIPLGVKYMLKTKIFRFVPHVMAGIVSAFALSIKETNIDNLGNVSNYHYRLTPDVWHGYLGFSFIYQINYRTILLIDPTMRFNVGERAYGYPIYNYEKLLGLGIGINIKI